LRDLSLSREKLKPDLLILDEAQRIKNWRTKLASTVKLIPSRYVFVLSGPPSGKPPGGFIQFAAGGRCPRAWSFLALFTGLSYYR